MGKSVVNLYRYSQVSQSSNIRYWDALHAAKLTGECLEEVEKLSSPVTKNNPVYPQQWGDFLPNMSALDLLFNCGPESRHYLSRQVIPC